MFLDVQAVFLHSNPAKYVTVGAILHVPTSGPQHPHTFNKVFYFDKRYETLGLIKLLYRIWDMRALKPLYMKYATPARQGQSSPVYR